MNADVVSGDRSNFRFHSLSSKSSFLLFLAILVPNKIQRRTRSEQVAWNMSFESFYHFRDIKQLLLTFLKKQLNKYFLILHTKYTALQVAKN